MLRRPDRTAGDLDIEDVGVEDLGVFEYLDEATPRFVPAAAPPPRRLIARLDERLRLELPMLWGWILLSCFFHSGWQWLLLGGGLIAFNVWLRPAYEQRKLGWLFRVYVGAGLAQVVAGIGQFVDLGPFRAVLGFYTLGLVIVWMVLELWYQVRHPGEPHQDMYDQIYYN
jgi:hypothetical protein